MPTATATPDQVRAITGSGLTDAQIEPFLTAAACVMGNVSDCAKDKGVSVDCLTTAESWLSSHLLSVSGVGEKTRVKKTEKFENYSVTWAQSQMEGQGVLSTTYGQTANTLTAGCLAEADKAPALICMFG